MSRLSLSLLNFIIQPDQPCKDGQKRLFYCTHFHSWSSDLSSHFCYKPTITMALHQPNRRRKMIGNIQHTQIKMYEGLALSFFIHISYRTRWTFFRVKLVFECEFEMSWDLGTPGPWDSWTSSLLQHLLILLLTSS